MSKIIVQKLEDAIGGFPFMDVLPDTHTWLKNKQGEFVAANKPFMQRFGYNSYGQLKGKTDFDLSSKELAKGYVRDDERVLAGEVISDRLELINSYAESATWFLTSKWPVYNESNKIIGSFGFSRHLQKTENSVLPFRELNIPIKYIQEHFMEPITVAQLALVSHISISALERRFKKHLGKTPRQYITEIRLNQARRLILETSTSLGEIAQLMGFSDQSHFTRVYSKHFAMNPSKVRNAARNATRELKEELKKIS